MSDHTDMAPNPSSANLPAGMLAEWNVEDAVFWRQKGSRIAFRNLLISIPCLLFAFAIWLYWSIIIVQMQNLGFAYSTAQLYTLPAIAGLAGATLRIPNKPHPLPSLKRNAWENLSINSQSGRLRDSRPEACAT